MSGFDRTGMLVAALGYAGRGWPVFPAPPGAKKSHKAAKHSDGRNWGATCNPDEIRADRARWPYARIGIVCGVVSGIVVIETDTMAGHGVDGAASLRALGQVHAPLPDTLLAESPSGSVHYYFQHPGAAIKIVCSASKLGPGIDCKGDGGMVVAPPSVNPDGRAYRWINNLPVTVMPTWLVELTREKPRTISQRAAVTVCPSVPADRRLRGLVRAVVFAIESQRNCTLYWAACRAGEMVRDGTADIDVAFAALTEAARIAGLERTETEASIKSGFRTGGAS